MYNKDIGVIIKVLKNQKCWYDSPKDEVTQYVGQFYNCTRSGTKIDAQVKGSYGVYQVSIHAETHSFTAAARTCETSIQGYCHHCHALSLTFLNEPLAFKVLPSAVHTNIRNLNDLKSYLKHISLNVLIEKLNAHGISQKAFADTIGINNYYLTEIKSGESKNRYFNELGAIKLACWWVIENFKSGKLKKINGSM